MYLLLSRHGNTFHTAAEAVWVGRRTDLPLTETGQKQAHTLASSLQESNTKIHKIFSSSLQRACEYAALVQSQVRPEGAVAIDERLQEIDYGSWEGLNDHEIMAKFGREAISQWRQTSQWAPEWVTSEASFRQETTDFVNELLSQYREEEWILCISSNGRLRYFLETIEGAFARMSKTHSLAMRTGNISLLHFSPMGRSVVFWNQEPQYLVNFDKAETTK